MCLARIRTQRIFVMRGSLGAGSVYRLCVYVYMYVCMHVCRFVVW